MKWPETPVTLIWLISPFHDYMTGELGCITENKNQRETILNY
jgi:hypothetical protein